MQQITGNMYMLFQFLSPKRLTNILSGWITCKIHHHTWFFNLNHAHKKYGKICLCINFINLNPSQNINNYYMPSFEPMLHTIPKTMVLSSLEGLLECHQVPVIEPGGLALVYEKVGPHTYHFQSLGRRIYNLPANVQDLKHYLQ